MRYIRRKGTDSVFIWTEGLAGRQDMEEVCLVDGKYILESEYKLQQQEEKVKEDNKVLVLPPILTERITRSEEVRKMLGNDLLPESAVIGPRRGRRRGEAHQ